MQHQIKALNLFKKYQQKQIVNNFSLEIKSGEIVGLLGPNGAGKTTAFYMIAGLVKADSGQVYFDQHNITFMPIHERAKKGLGYLPQEASVFRHLTVAQNITAVLEYREELDSAQQHSLADSLIHEFGLQSIRNSVGQSLSGGERRRVEIARTLALEPRFVLLDEPFAGVDPISVMDIQQIIKQLADKNIGVLITDHNVRETLSICNRGYILNAGKVIASGDTQSLLNNPDVRDVYLGKDFSL